MSRNRTKCIVFSRSELEEYMIREFGFPQDVVVTGIAKPVNQEAWVITVQSKDFPEWGELDSIDTSRKDELRLFKKERE